MRAPRSGTRATTRHNGPVTPPRQPLHRWGRALTASPARAWTAAVVLILLAATPVALRYLVFWPLDQWQVDVEVYREAGRLDPDRPPDLLRHHRDAAAAAVHLPAVRGDPRRCRWRWCRSGWSGGCGPRRRSPRPRRSSGIAGWRLIHRHGAARAARAGADHRADAVAAPGLRRHPLRPGQRVHGPGLPDGPAPAAAAAAAPHPRGVLVGLAMSIKLTPGVFVVHYLVNRRWREAGGPSARPRR